MSVRSRTFIAIIAATLLFAAQLSTARADDPFRDLHFITENYAPFNFKEGGILQGSAVDILLRMFAVAKSSKTAADVEVLPWSRGYRLAQTQENTVLFVTTRTPAREDLFKWVGPLLPTKISVIAKKSKNLHLKSLKDLNNYRIAAVREDIGELLLKTKGIDPNSIFSTRSSENAAKIFAYGRVDLWAYEENVAMWNLRALGESADDYEILWVLEEADVYFAVQKDTDDALVRALQNALDQVKNRR